MEYGHGMTDSGADRQMVGGAQAVRRAMDVLRTVAQLQRSQATLSRVAKATGLTMPTAHRILRSLVEERALGYDPTDHGYRLGALAYELGLAAMPTLEPQSKWRGAVAEIARRTRLTSYLVARSNDEAVCLVCVQGAANIRVMPMDVGQRVPLGIGAGSLAILASLDDREVHRIVALHDGRIAAFPGGLRPPDWMIGRVANTRARGFAISSDTVASGVSGIGVLIPTESGGPSLALTVSAVTSAIDTKEARRLAATIRGVIQETRSLG
jgi:DNA-binding IclR family transcriptional regulator